MAQARDDDSPQRRGHRLAQPHDRQDDADRGHGVARRKARDKNGHVRQHRPQADLRRSGREKKAQDDRPAHDFRNRAAQEAEHANVLGADMIPLAHDHGEQHGHQRGECRVEQQHSAHVDQVDQQRAEDGPHRAAGR